MVKGKKEYKYIFKCISPGYQLFLYISHTVTMGSCGLLCHVGY